MPSAALVVPTRLAVTYHLLPLDAIETIIRLAHDKGAFVISGADQYQAAFLNGIAWNLPNLAITVELLRRRRGLAERRCR